MPLAKEERCEATVNSDGWHAVPCSRRYIVTENDQRWCKQHAPSSIAARKEKSHKQWEIKWAGMKRAATRRELESDIVEHVEGCDHEHCKEILTRLTI